MNRVYCDAIKMAFGSEEISGCQVSMLSISIRHFNSTPITTSYFVSQRPQRRCRFRKIHDVILFYTRSDKPVWNDVYQPDHREYVDQYYRYKDENGRRWMSDNLSASGLLGGGYEGNDGRHHASMAMS